MDATDAAADGERTITRMGLRDGGWIGYDDAAVFVRRDDEADVRIRLSNVEGVSLQYLEWDLAIMSVLLLGLGGFVGATRNVLVGVGFVVVGLWSLHRTYRKRYELRIHVANESTPLGLHPTHPKECRETLAGVLIDHVDQDRNDQESDGASQVSQESDHTPKV